MLEQNCCRVNGRIERFGSVWIEKGTIVEFYPQEKAPTVFHILFETEDFKIVDKPAGWVCDDLHCRATFGEGIFLVHRLDKETTGALLLAKTRAIRDELMEKFADRMVEKEYLAIVDGIPREENGFIENYLARKGAFQGQTIWGSAQSGDRAVTRWKKIAEGDNAAFIQCFPETGRTHQIRVHLAEMGHPILIDRQYAKQFRSSLFAPRPLLHAHRLKFSYRDRVIEVVASLPLDMRNALLSVSMQMGHLRELTRSKEHDHAGDGGEKNKNGKESIEPTHFFHEAREHSAVEKSNPDAQIPNSNRKRSVAGRRKAAHHRKADRRQ